MGDEQTPPVPEDGGEQYQDRSSQPPDELILDERAALAAEQSGQPTYVVQPRRWECGWELHVDGVGVTQCNGAGNAGRMAKSYIRVMTGCDDFALLWRFTRDSDLEAFLASVPVCTDDGE